MRVIGTLDEARKPRPTTEYPGGTLQSVTSLRPNDVCNPGEVSVRGEEESAPTEEEEDADNGAEGNRHREGAPRSTNYRNRKETSPDHLWKRVGPADDSGRSPAH
ncbi:hypothetical protein NDU88_003712 [Pleurodeles waltl]|uniref:Uncharacterized protein n=1 Tax=Pleurodeles waltl TaxID=8319 RepID=A0AAV7UH38_PLEWA|nr:hypothetical protein NDU88_003712 [Pleurodeles waltl]